MICSRCGLCCINLDIFVIKTRSIRPDGTLDPGDPESMIRKPAGERCPHLAFAGEVAICAIHDLPCYRGTPCDLFDQFGPEDGICILGSYFKSSGSAEL
ncbi:MAG: hypothetical protein GXY73_02850 [Methanothrix sp.]|nr:hypothetical protein [Methanothrix sp.]